MVDHDAWMELLRRKKVMVGDITVASNTIEPPEEVANTQRKALLVVDAELFCPCTDCSMAPLSRAASSRR